MTDDPRLTEEQRRLLNEQLPPNTSAVGRQIAETLVAGGELPVAGRGPISPEVLERVRQIVRGCGTLPHVGEHPGTVTLIAFIIMGAVAGASRGSLAGAVGGALVMGAVFGPMYLCGAYDRARVSDRLERRP